MSYNPFSTERVQPPSHGFSITPGASALANEIRALYVGGSGSVTVTTSGGDSVTFANIAAGVIHPIAATHVTAATATGLVGLY